MTAPEGRISTMTPAEATEVLRSYGMRISVETVRRGLEGHEYPFGTAVQTGKGTYVYHVYSRLLYEWISKRVVPA